MKNALLIQVKERKGLKIPRQQREKVRFISLQSQLDMLSLPFLNIDILFFLGHEERERRTGGRSDETPGSRRLTTPMTVISDEEEESQIKGMEIYQPSSSRGGKKKVKERKRSRSGNGSWGKTWQILHRVAFH